MLKFNQSQPVERRSRGRPNNDQSQQAPKQRERQHIIKQPKDPKKGGRPKNEKPPKEPPTMGDKIKSQTLKN